MAMRYDKEEDILVLSKDLPVKSSFDVGDFIVDIGMDGKVVGIEILDASDNLQMSSEVLSSLENASMRVLYKPDSVCVHLTLHFADNEKDIAIPLTVSSEHSSTENTEFCVA